MEADVSVTTMPISFSSSPLFCSESQPMDDQLLPRPLSIAALEVFKASAIPTASSTFCNTSPRQECIVPKEAARITHEFDDAFPVASKGHAFSFASDSSATKFASERTMSQPLYRPSNTVQADYRGQTVGRWFEDRKEKKKEDTPTHDKAQAHAAVCVAGVAYGVAAIAAATAASAKEEKQCKTDAAVASAATLVAVQCVETAEVLGADRKHLTSVINSAVNAKTAGDIRILTAAATTVLPGVAALKERGLKDSCCKGVSNRRGTEQQNSSMAELANDDIFSIVSCQELLARGGELLKRSRNGNLHSKIVSVYINRVGQVILKMKRRHVAATITKSKKTVVLEVRKDVHPWPGRHLLEGGEQRRYFALQTVDRGEIKFECRNQEYEIWTKGVSRLLGIARDRKKVYSGGFASHALRR